MLDELKKLSFPGEKDSIIYFLRTVVGDKGMPIEDIPIICEHAPARYQLRAEPLLAYCSCFGWITQDSKVELSENLKTIIAQNTNLDDYLVQSSLSILFEEKIISPNMFFYDVNRKQFIFKNELLSLCFAPIRNVLVSQQLFIVERTTEKTTFCVNPVFERFIRRLCKDNKKKMTLEQLKAKLEENENAGAKAEEYVVNFERARIANTSLKERIKIISDIDVCAGYDIVSFETESSYSYDRFIEVKAINHSSGFFWSKNELEVARLQGSKYYLYLVELSKIHNPHYMPMIISNPVESVINSPDWFVEPESYYIHRVQN